jgi:hypothetical protein
MNNSDSNNSDEFNKLVIYTDSGGNTELRVDIRKDTIWATQDQISNLFATTPQNITLHLQNIYVEGELRVESTCKKSLQVGKEGGRAIKRVKKFYNLDAIIAVGYRVNSKKATQFRIWATRILHDYLVDGFSVNNSRLSTQIESLDGLHEALELIESRKHRGTLKGKLTLKLTKKLEP